MTISKTFNFTPNAIHKLPFSDKQVMYFDENKSFMVANTKLRELAKGHEPSYLFGQQLAGISNAVYTRSEFKDQKIAMVNDWMDFIEGKLNER